MITFSYVWRKEAIADFTIMLIFFMSNVLDQKKSSWSFGFSIFTLANWF